MITIHPFDDELDDVAVDFLFKEVPEPEEMTHDDSDFMEFFIRFYFPQELKIEFTPRKFIQFTLIKL